MSTGLELQIFLPVINAPFRIYWAYNPLRLDSPANPPIPITRSMFPPGAAGDYTYHLAVNTFAPSFLLREPRNAFRFTVATTFSERSTTHSCSIPFTTHNQQLL